LYDLEFVLMTNLYKKWMKEHCKSVVKSVMKNVLSILTLVGFMGAIASCTPSAPEAQAPEETEVQSPAAQAPETQSPALSNLQTYDETAAGIPVIAQYPADTMEVMGTGSGEGVGVFFTFKPQGTHLDEAEVHVFLPAGATTAADQEPFVTGPGGLMDSNAWMVDSIQADGSADFPYSWVEMVINFSTDYEESGHILLGQVDGQAVQVTLFYPAEMSDAYWPAARTVLDSLEFDEELLPITSSGL
jgi:hypothetical protein